MCIILKNTKTLQANSKCAKLIYLQNKRNGCDSKLLYSSDKSFDNTNEETQEKGSTLRMRATKHHPQETDWHFKAISIIHRWMAKSASVTIFEKKIRASSGLHEVGFFVSYKRHSFGRRGECETSNFVSSIQAISWEKHQKHVKP